MPFKNSFSGVWDSRKFTLLPMEFVFLNVFSYIFRSQMGCVVLDDFLYVLGGTNRHNEVLQVRYTFREKRLIEGYAKCRNLKKIDL
jgi:hypothetical protein